MSNLFNAETILAATRTNSSGNFANHRSHTSGQRIDTKTVVLTRIRGAYPDYHVTEVKESSVSLFDYAAADKAILTFDATDEEFNATREWGSVGEGVEKKMHPGTLKDDFRFARFHYVWNNAEFIVHYLVYRDMLASPTKLFYLLSARESSTIQSGHCVETDALILAAGKWTSELHNEIFVFDDGYWEKSKDLWKSVAGASWADVILEPEMKKGLIEDVQGFFDNQSVYKKFAVPWKRGVILHGVPGNGKTVSIKALMTSLYSRDDSIPSLYVKSFETNCQTAQYAVAQIFSKARSMAPCLLIFEDLDSLVNEKVRSYFLNEVDGLESNDGILMIGSTNHLDKLDPAISKRPSRFDRKYHFKIPGEGERKLYAEYWRNKLTTNETVDFPEDLTDIIAQLTEGFSFAYMKELFVMALLNLVRGYKGADDFELVDKDEAASADESADDSSSKDIETDECVCKPTCSTCNKPLPASDAASESAKAADEALEANEEARKNKMALPTVDVPDHLSENLLLKVIKYQIRVLHSEMDNTKDEDEDKAKKGGSGAASRNRAASLRMKRRKRQMC